MRWRPAAVRMSAAAGGQGVHLVEEQHAGLALPGLLEDRVQVSLAGADPHVEHFVDSDGDEAGA